MKRAIILSVIILATSLLQSCYRYPDPGVASITVLDKNKFRVPNAKVVFSQSGEKGNGIVYNEGFTDFNGEYKFEFRFPDDGNQAIGKDLALSSILKVVVEKDGMIGQAQITIKAGEITEREIFIY